MSTPFDSIPNFTNAQLEQLVTEHAATQRVAGKDFAAARNTLVRLDGFTEASLSANSTAMQIVDSAGFTGGRDKALAAIRWALLADEFKSVLTDTQHEVLKRSVQLASDVA